MSGGGGGPIIIKNLIDNPGTTAEEKHRCREIEQRFKQYGACSLTDALAAAILVFRLLRR